MKNPTLTFCKSAREDFVYKIFRTKNERKDFTVDYCINNEADLIIYEKTNKDFEFKFEDYQISVIDNEDGFLIVSAPFDIVKNDTSFTLNLKNNSLAIPHAELIINFGKNIISSLELKIEGSLINKITDQSIISKIAKIKNDNSILLSKERFNYNECTITIPIKCVQITDLQANGIYNPIVSTLESKDFILFYQDSKYQKNVYFYTSIAFNETSITEFSDTRAIEVTEIPQNMRTLIECSDDFQISETPTWKKFREEKVYIPTSEIKIQKSEIHSDSIKNIYEHEIYVDDRLLLSNGLRIIKIPNIWHKDRRDMMQRPKKAFRLKNISLEDKTIESEYSNPIVFGEPIEILIDKMVILKRNVTGLPDDIANLPLDFNDEDVNVLKIYVRQGGIYYKDYVIGDYETNNIIIYKDLTSSVTLDSRFPMFSIKDNCIFSYKYNYTVYLYDETGKISAPVTVVI